MTLESLLSEPGRMEEPHVAKGYSDVLSQVASQRRPVILQRNGEDLAAVIPAEDWEFVREILARKEVEKLAARIDWDRTIQSRPPQAWFDADDNPFEPEEEPAS